jgi:Flp pilus assembly protein TadB
MSVDDTLISLNQAFRDHVTDEEKRFDAIAKSTEPLRGMNDLLIRIDERQQIMVKTLLDLDIKVGRQNGRISTLERWRAYLVGIAVATGVLIRIVLDRFIK